MVSGIQQYRIEGDIRDLFSGMLRKDNVTPACTHSIDVGRALSHCCLGISTVIAGYYHDVLEDVPGFQYADFVNPDGLGNSHAEIRSRQLAHLSNHIYRVVPRVTRSIVDYAVFLVESVTYTQEEYSHGKGQRKKMAAIRWESSSLDTMLVKAADISINLKDMECMPIEFQRGYANWSVPLIRAMYNRISTLTSGLSSYQAINDAIIRVMEEFGNHASLHRKNRADHAGA